MARYLDPKADVVFKKIFGEHPHLLKHFLNAMLPLSEDQQIVSLEYLPAEQVPEIPIFKRTIVDVKCKDKLGRIFIVEMQVEWTDSFMQRLLFGAAKAYVRQLKTGEQYDLLNPVYGLALVDSIFDTKTPDWYHHYGLVKLDNPEESLIRGLTLVFVELPKFKASSSEAKKLKVLWLRFMREITTETDEVDEALLSVPEIEEALTLAKESAYTQQELETYDSYWKAVSSERTLKAESEQKGIVKGKEQGIVIGKEQGIVIGKEQGIVIGKEQGIVIGKEQGVVIGKEQGREETQQAIAIAMKAHGVPDSVIASCTQLSLEEIAAL